MKDASILLIIGAVLLFVLSSYNEQTEDEMIQGKIAIIEMAQKTPTPETLAMADKAKAELRQIETKRQDKIQSEKEKQEFNEKSSTFGSREFWQNVYVLATIMLAFMGAIFLAFKLWNEDRY
ncbi:hypothetical protein AAX09_10435 (plasmid) [Moraxella bovoculi]|uniref:hypothetical protein n=1 Tax=Moraxella bovoculi TaxID=386891 RepID=UPI000624E889|nr:hypothetical protein [Moraxella bovoculi]AKG19890.1 hypothetical protein AAX09_10435 [Moraxella bovoculi]